MVNNLNELKKTVSTIENGTHYALIKRVAKKDPKIFSKDECDSAISRELNRAIVHNRSLSAILLTLQASHVSPTFTTECVTSIKSFLHSYDYIFKLGDEKFVLLLPETTQKDAVEKGLKIKIQLEAFGSRLNKKISVSIGISSYHTAHTEGLETHLNASPRLRHA